MTVNSLLVPILNMINFTDRFMDLSKNYDAFEDRLVEDNFDSVQNIVQSFGYTFKFNKSENFFKLIETVNLYKIQFNIAIQRGRIEFIWGIEKNGERLQMGVSICGAIGFLTKQNYTRKPIYRSYEELRKILKEAFSIYEDFKMELFKQEKVV